SALRGMVERRGAGLHRFAVLTAGATFVLLFVGGLVTSTGSGLAVPDWPLSFGMLLPPMRGGVLFEHGHRLAAALVGGLPAGLAVPDFPLAFGRLVPPLATPYIAIHFAHRVGALAVTVAVAVTVGAVLRERAAGSWLRRPALLTAGLVLVQLTLGALVIWSRRAVLPTTTHLVVGAALLATCLVLALRAGRVAAPRAAEASALRVRRPAL